VESRNPRLPLVRWLCRECGVEFERVRRSWIVRLDEYFMIRNMRKELQEPPPMDK